MEKNDGTDQLLWFKEEKPITEYFVSQAISRTDLDLLSTNWSNQKLEFVDRFRMVLMNGLKNIEKCFKWCESVWKNTKYSLEEIVIKDELIAKHFETKFVAEFTSEGKNKSKERDIHVGDRYNMVENYMIDVLEILDQHKSNHKKLIEKNTQEIKNKVLKPINSHYLDFQGTHLTKFKKLKSQAEKLSGTLQVAMNEEKAALQKLKSLLRTNMDCSKRGQQPKKDTAKCLVRLYVRVQNCYIIFKDLVDKINEAWVSYREALIDMNATIHKDLIDFYELSRQYAFPSHAGMGVNIFDQIIFQEDDVCNRLDSIFSPTDIQHIKKYSDKDGFAGLKEATDSEKLHFVETFSKHLGAHWIDKKDSKVESYFFINITPDLFLNVFECTNYQGGLMPQKKAIISDSLANINTKAVEWKKEYQIKGNQPGNWFSDGKATFTMNDETEVAHLKALLDKGKEKLKKSGK